MIIKKSKAASVFLFILAAVMLYSCGTKNADISAYENAEITISGLKDREFTITPAELSALECVSRSATGATAKAGTVSVTGPLLNTFLAQYDCAATDFFKIRFIAKDGYRTLLRDDYLSDYEVIMAVSSGSDPLPEESQPLRLLIPEAESNMWIYGVVRIEFEWKD